MLHIILFEPEIPNNTGNIGRLCAIAGARLHLIHPLGFVINDKHLRRAGMDYWRKLDIVEHADWNAFKVDARGPSRLWLFTTAATHSFWNATFVDGDGLLFGKESGGVPQWLHDAIGDDQSVRIDHPRPGLRSLNLASSAAIGTYEALRQLKMRG